MPSPQSVLRDRSQVWNRPHGRPLAELLDSARPRVEGLIREYPLAAGQAEEILRNVLDTLVWQWESVHDREAWLLAVLARKCWLATGYQPGEVDDER